MRAGRHIWWFGMASLIVCGLLASSLFFAGQSRAGTPKKDEDQKAKSESDKSSVKDKYKLDYIDKLVRANWEAVKSDDDETGKAIKPSARSSDSEYMRRIYLDMLGRIPSVQEAKAFLGNKDSGKRVKLVEYLLNHPDYAKNFATIWTISLIGRGNQGRMVDRGALSTWIRKQFNENRPWNEVVHDIVDAKGSNKENGAVNYVLSHMEFEKVPLTSITTRVFLGRQIQCTQCHDHPMVNQWKQSHFWGINAFFKGVKSRDVMKANATGAEVYDHTEVYDDPSDEFASFDRRDGQVGVAFPTYLDGRKISQGTDVDRRAELAKFMTVDNPDLARAFVNRMWAHFMGRGLVHPVDDFKVDSQSSVPKLLDQLSADFQASGYDVKALIRWIANSEAYNLSSGVNPSNAKDESHFSHMALKPMTPEQLFESLIVATSAHKAGGGGDNDKRRDQWMRQFLFTFGNDEGTESADFQGTIPQALMMMNGELMAKAVGGQPGSFLCTMLEQAQLQRRQPVEAYVVNHLFLAALSRYPTANELNKAGEYLQLNPEPNPIPVMEDLFWALLNSNEFVLNH